MSNQHSLASGNPNAAGVTLRNISPPPGKIGFIGLGQMGSAMAQNLALAGYSVTGYVRRPEQLEELEARGVKATLHMQDVFDCDILVSMLPDDNAVRDVFFGNASSTDGLANHMAPGSIHLSMSTISPVEYLFPKSFPLWKIEEAIDCVVVLFSKSVCSKSFCGRNKSRNVRPSALSRRR